MIYYNKNFGYSIYGENIGSVWLDAIDCILKNGIFEFDEKRGRIALQCIRLKVENQLVNDNIVKKYGNKKNIDKMIALFFRKKVMEDFDVIPNFRKGAKSYCARIQEGRMIDFVIKRLTEIPESKKAVMVFPTYEDYAKVLDTPYNDYLPCIVSLQFRLRKNTDGDYVLNTIFNMRSQDIFQKCVSDLTVFALMTQKIAKHLSKNLKSDVNAGFLEGMITDGHIYQNTIEQAQYVVMNYLDNKFRSGKIKNKEVIVDTITNKFVYNIKK